MTESGEARSMLEGRTFRVDFISGRPVTGTSAPELAFGLDGRVTGCATINRISGDYEVEGTTLNFGAMISTLMAGEPAAMEQEQALLAVLSGPLTIARGRGSEVLLRTAPNEEPTVLVDVTGVLHATGVVTYRPRIALPPDAVTTVSVLDVAKADAPADILGTDVVSGGQVPIEFDVAFRVPFDGSSSPDSLRLSLSARIESAGELLWVTDTVVSVDPREGARGVELWVVQVTSPR